MEAHLARRAVGDVLSVLRRASPASGAHWMASLVYHLPECASSRSLTPADQGWARAGARFRTSTGVSVFLPATYTAGAREMFCRDVYLRAGLIMPSSDWVIDLGANCGLFSVWAACNGAEVVAVEAQLGFADEIRGLAARNGVSGRIHTEVAMASGICASGAAIGVLADDHRWSASSHGGATRPADVSLPQLISDYQIDRIGLLKMDIEGGEFAVLSEEEDLGWLDAVDQIALEVHRGFGDVSALISRLQRHGFTVDLRDNNGRRIADTSEHPDYAYCRRT
jgi:FkbM family methyltransferase